MKGLAVLLLAAGSAAALVGMANAQPAGGAPRAVLFDQPNFQGRSITIVEGAPDLGRWGFAPRAMSARFEGPWTVCDAPDLDGRCATVAGDVADLSQFGLTQILSLGEGVPDDAQASAASDGAARADVAAPPDARLATSAPDAAAAPQQVASAGPPAMTASASGAAPAMAAAVQNGVGQGEAGRDVVFFAKPAHGGADVAVDLQGPANQFCHDQGLGPAAYFDSDGRVLRDVLCRRS